MMTKLDEPKEVIMVEDDMESVIQTTASTTIPSILHSPFQDPRKSAVKLTKTHKPKAQVEGLPPPGQKGRTKILSLPTQQPKPTALVWPMGEETVVSPPLPVNSQASIGPIVPGAASHVPSWRSQRNHHYPSLSNSNCFGESSPPHTLQQGDDYGDFLCFLHFRASLHANHAGPVCPAQGSPAANGNPGRCCGSPPEEAPLHPTDTSDGLC